MLRGEDGIYLSMRKKVKVQTEIQIINFFVCPKCGMRRDIGRPDLTFCGSCYKWFTPDYEQVFSYTEKHYH